jgi:hypothetical protein
MLSQTVDDLRSPRATASTRQALLEEIGDMVIPTARISSAPRSPYPYRGEFVSQCLRAAPGLVSPAGLGGDHLLRRARSAGRELPDAFTQTLLATHPQILVIK